MNKVGFENKVLLELYTKKLFNLKIEEVCRIIAQDFEVGEKKINDCLYELKSKNALYFKDGAVCESQKKTYELQKHHILPKEGEKVEPQDVDLRKGPAQVGDMVLATVYYNAKGKYYYAKAHKGEFDNCIIFQNDKAKEALGRTCLIKISEAKNQNYIGTIDSVFGFVDDPLSENIAIAAKYGFTNKFDEKVLKEARAISPVVTEEQKKGRTDLRHIPFVTIDPDGCKDKDDAVYDEVLPDGSIRTYIAIADVSNGVKPGSLLDKEAFKRGNSCYLGGGVYPMLPPELSNGIFSLDEGKERLAVVVSATIKPGEKKKIYDPHVDIAVIKVKKGYSYPEAEKTFKAEEGFAEKNKETKELIDLLYKNTPVLEKRYSQMLKPDSHEPEYKFGENGTVVEDIKVSNEEYSHTVVEARMLLANEIVAKYFMERGLVGLFRTHDESADSKIVKLQETLCRNGVDFKLENTTQSYFKLLEEVRKSPARDYLMFEIIKSLSRAEYKATEEETDHFGLGIHGDRGYMHFTSPIRRYSDLVTHRLLKQILLMGKTNMDNEVLEEVAEHLNNQERKADQAEIESDEYLACLWAEKHMGETRKAIITQVSNSIVEILDKNGVTRVSIPTSALKGAEKANYKAADDKMKISNGLTTLNLGDTIEYKIDRVSLAARMIFGTANLTKEVAKTETKAEEKSILK